MSFLVENPGEIHWKIRSFPCFLFGGDEASLKKIKTSLLVKSSIMQVLGG